MSQQLLTQGNLKIKCKKNVQSFRLVRSKDHFPKDFCLKIAAQECPEEVTTLEILGEGDGPIPSTISRMEWLGPFNRIRKVFLSDIQLSSLALDEQNFCALEYVVLKNIRFQEITLEDFIQTLPRQLKHLGLINCGPFCCEIKGPNDFLIELEQLDLSKNQLHELPPWIATLARLKRLTLDGNQLKTLPLYLKQLPKLNHLSLDDNPFSEETKGQIQRDFNLWF
ncbi:MAG: hypothetical protein A2X86_13390 [Bdellovibrionales bacterium GWA2_49_15]|nr:MAG: hypothetical protein A2X86_13390 [Bdellovibrionales bacterium GWA2_49_15]HAZ13519.1 hypothetical protein [Bdellovibrionales bacterium]